MLDAPLLIGNTRKAPLTTKTGWRAFVANDFHCAEERFGDLKARRALARRDRNGFDRARLDHIRRFVIETRHFEEIHKQLLSVVEANEGADPPLAGGVIDSVEANYGKSWTMRHFGRWYERHLLTLGLDEGDGDDPNNDDFVPVVYVTLKRDSQTTWLDEQLLRFYGAAAPRSSGSFRMRDLSDRVADEAHACRTSLILVDDIHKLKAWRHDDVAIADHLNYLASEIGATFVYAGINCEEGGVFGEGAEGALGFARGTQTSGRFMHLKIERFAQDSDWQTVLLQFEEELVLLKARPGDLCERLPAYIYERTGGLIGATSYLLRRGALGAIKTGDERITKELLEQIQLPVAAEAEREEREKARAARKKREKAASKKSRPEAKQARRNSRSAGSVEP